MARTAPIPNIPAIPGMCPGIAVLGGGAGSGGAGGKGAGSGGGGVGAGSQGGADGTTADGRSAGSPDIKRYPHCGTRSCPVDVVTGRVFTLEAEDLRLPGPLPLRWFRVYSSAMRERDAGLGYGWAHSFGWEVERRRRDVRVWTEQGTFITFDLLDEGHELQGPFGWVLRRHARGYVLDCDDGVWRHFEQESAGASRFRLSRVVDRNGNQIALSYDEHSRLVEVTDSAGRVIRTHPDAAGRMTRLQVKNAHTRGQWVTFAQYEYDGDGHLIGAMDADGYSNRYGYTPEHRMTENGYKCGIVFCFRYDELGRCTESWGAYPGRPDDSIAAAPRRYEDDDAAALPATLADGRTPVKGVHHCRYDYMEDGYTEVHDSTRTTYYQGNGMGLLDKTVTGSAVASSSYGSDGFITSDVDPLGNVTSYIRDRRGRLLSVTNPLGNITSYDRDERGLLSHVTDPEGTVTQFERDERGNRIRTMFSDGSVEARRYDDRGLLTAVSSANGATTHMQYDAEGNLVQLVMPNGGRWQYSYDGLGRCLGQTAPDGTTRSYSYSARGDLIATRDAAGHVTYYRYDGDRQLTEHVSPSGATTRFRWGGLHKLVERSDAGGSVRLYYNHEGELLCVVNEAGEAHHLVRDHTGQLVAERCYDGRRINYSYDLAGRLKRIESGDNELTDYEYDAAGRLVLRVLHDGTEESFAYNSRGELIRAMNPTGVFTFERDAFGRVVREQQEVGDQRAWVAVDYDHNDRRNACTTSLGHSEQIIRDEMGARQRTLLDQQHAIVHHRDLLGREVSRALPRGGRIDSHYDALGQLSRRLTIDNRTPAQPAAGLPEWVGEPFPGAGSQASYRYDGDGELLGVYDSRAGGVDYQHDPLGRLLSKVPAQARGEMFRYDTAGNLHRADPGAASRQYRPGRQLVQDGATRYLWSADGRLIEKRCPGEEGEQVWRYRWNGAGMLERIERPDGSQLRFGYDPFARRMYKSLLMPADNGVLQPRARSQFVWDGDRMVHEIRQRAGDAGDPIVEERTYVYEEDTLQPLAHRQNGEWVHYANDQVGAPQRLLDASGAIVCDITRSAWGKVAVADDCRADTPLGFEGQYADEETGLRYNRWRYYDPDAVSFISRDDLRIAYTGYGYGYVRSPTRWVDPFGHQTRRQAIAQAQAHAQVPRDSRGGEDIPLSHLRQSSRGPNWAELARRNASLGRRCTHSDAHWVDHPDGHPDAGQPGIPDHHGRPHIHAVNRDGEEIIIPYDFD